MTISNFHSFCQRILTENAADAGLPPRPDVLDGVGQVLLLKDLRPDLGLVYHGTDWWLGSFVQFINRCKDELVTPGRLRRLRRRGAPRLRGALRAASRPPMDRLEPQRQPQAAARGPRRLRRRPRERARRGARRATRVRPGGGREDGRPRGAPHDRRRRLAPTAAAGSPADDLPAHRRARRRPTSRDGAALEVLRLTELARVYRAYEEELARRGALDFGEQIAAVAQLFKTRPNVLRRWQRQFRYLLVDEFQDANVAQIELIELLGRTPDRPDNVMVVGDDDQSIYRFRGASFAAFAEFDARFSRPPAHDPTGAPPGPPTRLRLEQNFRSVGHVLTAANRLIGRNASRFEPDKRLRTDREDGHPVAGPRVRRAGGRGRRHRRRHPGGPARTARRAAGRTSPSCIASTSTARRSSPGCATRTSRTPSSAG